MESHPSVEYTLDILSGLPNAFAFFEECDSILPSFSGSVVGADVEKLRLVNKQLGQKWGDECLKAVSDCIMECISQRRSSQRIPAFRIGADEFIILLPGISPRNAAAFASEIRKRCRKRFDDLGIRTSGVKCTAFPYKGKNGVSHLLAELIPRLHPQTERSVQARNRTIAGQDPNRKVLEWAVSQVQSCLGITRQAMELAMTDFATALPNNRSASAFLERMVGGYKRNGIPFSILLIDSDHLREYNQRFGYCEGDRVIRHLGQVIQRSVRTGDFVARWMMGDEFLVVLPRTGIDEAMTAADRIRSAVASEFSHWVTPVTVSIGVASCPDHGLNKDDLLATVELAIRTAKAQGRNQACYHCTTLSPQR